MCMCLVCVLDKLIILYKFVNEKEKKKKKKMGKTQKTTTKTTLTLQQYNCIFCFIKLLCYFDSLSENDSMRI